MGNEHVFIGYCRNVCQLYTLISYTGAGSEEKVGEMATSINPTIVSHLCSTMELTT